MQISGFEDLVEIGRGGFGVVYRARQPEFERTVAIKVVLAGAVDEQARARFRREAAAMGRLSGHPHIVDVHAAGFTDDGHPYLVMPFLAAGSLGDRIDASGALPWTEAVLIAVKMAGALAAAHATGMVHRDVKPDNILFTGYGEPQLGDFGIARVAGGMQTASGVITASLLYAAPEILQGDAPSAASDVYSLAATIVHALAGRAPFFRDTDESFLATMARIASQPPAEVRPAGVPDAVWAVLERALAKEPAARQASAQQFATDMQRAQAASGAAVTLIPGVAATVPADEAAQGDGITTNVLPGVPPAPAAAEATVGATSAPSGRRPMLFAAIGAVALIALAGMGVMLSSRGGTSPAPIPTVGIAGTESGDAGDQEGDDEPGEGGAEGTVQVAAMLPLTGFAQPQGQAMLEAVTLAADQHNAGDPAVAVEIVPIDTEGDGDRAREAALELIESDVVAVVGPYWSDVVEAAGPALERGRLAFVSGSATRPELSDKGWSGFFRTVASERTDVAAMTQVATEVLEAQRVVVVQDDHPTFGPDGRGEALKEELNDAGVDVVASLAVAEDGGDFTAQADKVVAADADAVIYSGFTEGATVAKAIARAGGEGLPFVGFEQVFNGVFIDDAGAGADGTVALYPSSFAEDNQAWRDMLFDERGVEPDVFSLEFYRAASVVAEALQEGHTDREAIREFIAGFDAEVAGQHIRFDAGGDLVDPPYYVYEFVDGDWNYRGQIDL